MHPTLRKQLQATLGQSSPHKARLESLVTAVHRQYERYDKELMALEKRLAHLEGRQAAAGPAMEGDDGLRVLLDNIKDGIVSVDAAGRIRSVNTTAERMFGRDAAHLVGEHLRALLVLPDTISTADHLADLSRVHDDTQLDLAATRGVGRRADGRQFPVDILAACADDQGEHKIYVLAIRDMSDNIEAERALRESEARYRSLVDSAPEAIVVLDPASNRFVDANDKAQKLFKADRATLLAGGPLHFTPPVQADGSQSADLAREHIELVLAGKELCFEWLHQDSHGDLIQCEVRLARIEFNGRHMLRASILDIRERKAAGLRAAGEREILERIAANAPLPAIMAAAAETITRIAVHLHPALYVLDESRNEFELLAAPGLPDSFREHVSRIGFSDFEQQSKASGAID